MVLEDNVAGQQDPVKGKKRTTLKNRASPSDNGW